MPEVRQALTWLSSGLDVVLQAKGLYPWDESVPVWGDNIFKLKKVDMCHYM